MRGKECVRLKGTAEEIVDPEWPLSPLFFS